MPNVGIAEAPHFPKLQGATGSISYRLTDETKVFFRTVFLPYPERLLFSLPTRECKQSSINYRVSPYRWEYQHLVQYHEYPEYSLPPSIFLDIDPYVYCVQRHLSPKKALTSVIDTFQSMSRRPDNLAGQESRKLVRPSGRALS